MKVYHGSYLAIVNIDFSFCQKKRDFGKGFYVTKFRDHAENWAKRKGSRGKTEGVVTEFEFNEYAFNDRFLKALRFDDYNDEWLDFVTLNRRNENDRQAHDYDIVEGPVANDKIATQVDRYLEGAISKEKFLNDLIYFPSHQICFCTVQALQTLSLQKGKIDIAVYDIGDHAVQTLMTDCGMTEKEATDIYYTSKTYSGLADENTGLYEKEWQEIYQMLIKELAL
jgi:hypothetical protein